MSLKTCRLKPPQQQKILNQLMFQQQLLLQTKQTRVACLLALMLKMPKIIWPPTHVMQQRRRHRHRRLPPSPTWK
jgi:hypothetical protein